jgi:hypothetical protein
MMRTLRLAGLAAVVAALAVTGWLLMCTTFMIHDDEGYVLISLRNFSEHGRLYDGVFTQYGPVPFIYYDLLHRVLNLPIGSLLGRVAATVHWLGAALGAGLIAWRLTGRYWTAAFTLVTVFGYLWQMTWEPVHPGGLIAVLVALALAAALAARGRGRIRFALVLLGAAGAALFFTKINVGLLWCCSLGAFLLLETDGWLRGRGAWLAAAGFAVLPFALMRPLLGEPWVGKFAVMFALSATALCLPFNAAQAPALRWRDWLAALAGFVVASAIIVAATLAHGTSAAALWQGIVTDPLRHPVNFHLGFTWQNLSWAVQAAALAPCALWCLWPHWRPALRDIVAGLRLLVLAVFLWRWDAWVSIEGLGALVRLGLPMLPLFLVPLADDRSWTARRLVALIAVGQVLHAYPVAGSQMAWGSFLLVPLLIDGVVEAGAHFAQRARRAWLPGAIAALALAAAGAQVWLLSDQGALRWRASEPLDVPGAEFLRPQENVRYALRIVTANARLHADVLFSRPGMFGFNLWSGVPTPTLRNATHWFWLLSSEEQQAIIDRLQAARRPVVISSRPLLDLLRHEIGVTVAGPLHDYINQHFRPLFTVTGYEFLVPRDSAAVPFFVAENFRAPDAPAMIAVNVAARSAEVTRIVLRDVRLPEQPLASWDRGNCQVTLQGIDANGRPAGSPRVAAWPLRFDGLQQMRLYHRSSLPADRPELELAFLDASGHVVFEACYDLNASVSLPPAGD